MKRGFLVLSIILILTLNLFCFLHFVPLVHASTTTTFDVLSDDYDGYIFAYDDFYPPLTVEYHLTTMEVGQFYLLNYEIQRSFLRFNTSSLGSSITIVSAKLCVGGFADASSDDFVIRLQKWTDGDDGVGLDDYVAFDGINYDDGTFSTSGFSLTVYNNITISNFDLIIKDGYTDMMIRSSRDIASTEPTTGEKITLEDTGVGSRPPKLEITFIEGDVAEYDYVDSQTNVDSSADKGTHSSFTSQKATDWTNDTLIEANTNTTALNNSENFVDANTSNIDSHTGHGTSSNFTAQQDSNVLYNDTLTEANTNGATSDVFTDGLEDGTFNKWDQNGATTWTNDGGICINGTNLEGWVSSSHSGTYYAGTGATGDGNLVSDNIDLSGITSFGVRFWYAVDDTDGAGELVLKYWDGAAYDTIADLSGNAEDTWTYYSAIITDNQYFDTTFRIDFLAACGSGEAVYIDDVVINKTMPANYELDYEFSWTTTDYDEANEYLCIRTNSFTGTAENLGIDVWDGSWKAISTALTASAWNNISITTNLTGATIYFRFIGKTESSDTAQNTWIIECSLIHTWSIGVNYELDLEEQFTSANFSRTNVELCVRMGDFNTTENLQLDYWNASSSAWITVTASLTENDWTNTSVKTYTSNASVTFTIRFLGTTESGDTERSMWDKDACLLHTWDAGAANSAPTIPDLRLSSTSDTSNISQIDVNTWYDWEVNVSDADTLNDIVNVTIRIKDNSIDSIVTDSAAYNRTGEYWFNYDNVSNVWQWYSGSTWTVTSDWLDNANCAAPTKTASSGYYLFRTKLAKSAVKSTVWGFSASAYDSGNNVTSKNFTAITVNGYSSLTIMSGNNTHTWINATAGVNDILIDQDAIYFNVTANYLFKIQAEGDGNLIKGSDYIVLANVTIHKDTLGSSIPLTITYADVVGLTSQALGEDVQLSLKLWLDSPANQPVGIYLYVLSIQVTEQ